MSVSIKKYLYFDKEGFITKAGQKRLREILKQFDAPLKSLKAFSDGEEDGVKYELNVLREHFLEFPLINHTHER